MLMSSGLDIPKPTNINSPIGNTVRTICLKVPRGEAEFTRKKLLSLGLLDISRRIQGEGDFICLPLRPGEAPDLGFERVERDLVEREVAETDYRAFVDVPPEVRDRLPVSFDVIGDVAIIRLDDDLLELSGKIGTALMRTYPRLRTVALDHGVKGELRVRDLEVVAGEDRTETVHTEYGVRLLIDPAKVYFNPRLSNERRRIASLVREGETVVDMFAGVGPFSIMISKYSRPEIVYAMDLNHDAVEYMKENIKRNKVTNVIPIEGDSRQLVFDVPCADRIIMNLPHSAKDFFHDALTRLKLGGVIHFYTICEREDIDSILERMVTEAAGMGVLITVLHQEELKTYSPSMSVFSADIGLVDWC
ncbi:MAG: class I SAM-dependent methyltransferase family protein [Methanomassiliicoccus sp.]|nr:class I SAM-dependent methyltransferase family protein [Methanomassiliicoccus sp.]